MNDQPDPLDGDAAVAAAELFHRSGARTFEIGYHDDPPPVTWWATASWKGAKLSVDGYPDPAAAADALAAKVLFGGPSICIGCQQIIGPTGCRWRRHGPHWVRGCDGGHGPITRPNRTQLRLLAKASSLR